MGTYICQRDLKCERNWTQTMINRLLGEPDDRIPNPYCESKSRMIKLYELDRVRNVESTAEFSRAQSKAKRRSKN